MEVTQLLQRLRTGDRDAMHALIPLVYEELKKLARAHLRRESGPAALQTTSLVHEAFLKLSRSAHPPYENRTHFYGIASRLMRQILVDSARARDAHKRAGAEEVTLSNPPDAARMTNRRLLALHDAMQQLETEDSLKAKLIEMRYFGGMTAEECSLALGLPVHQVRREMRLAEAWLRKEMTDRKPSGGAAEP